MSHQTSSDRGVRSGTSNSNLNSNLNSNTNNQYRQPVITDYLNSITQQQMNQQQSQQPLSQSAFISQMVTVGQSTGQQQQEQITFSLGDQSGSQQLSGSYNIFQGQVQQVQQSSQQLFNTPKYHHNPSYLQNQSSYLGSSVGVLSLSNGGVDGPGNGNLDLQNSSMAYQMSSPSPSTSNGQSSTSSHSNTQGKSVVYGQQAMYNTIEVMPTSYSPSINYACGSGGNGSGSGVGGGVSGIKFIKLNSFNEILTLIPARTINQSSLPGSCFPVNPLASFLANSSVRIFIRFCKYSPEAEEQTDCMPKGFNFIINQKAFQVKNRVTYGPYDITQRVICETSNDVQIRMSLDPSTRESGDDFFYAVFLVQKVDHKALFESFKQKWTVPYMAKYSIELAKRKLNPTDNDDELAIIEMDNQIKVSLLCPLTSTRIRLPARSIACDHVHCFDAESFVSINEISPKWKCPICNIYIKIDDLIVDGFFTEILAQAAPGCTEAVIFPDGRYEYVFEEVVLTQPSPTSTSATPLTSFATATRDESNSPTVTSSSMFEQSQPLKKRKLSSKNGASSGQLQTRKVTTSRSNSAVECIDLDSDNDEQGTASSSSSSSAVANFLQNFDSNDVGKFPEIQSSFSSSHQSSGFTFPPSVPSVTSYRHQLQHQSSSHLPSMPDSYNSFVAHKTPSNKDPNTLIGYYNRPQQSHSIQNLQQPSSTYSQVNFQQVSSKRSQSSISPAGPAGSRQVALPSVKLSLKNGVFSGTQDQSHFEQLRRMHHLRQKIYLKKLEEQRKQELEANKQHRQQTSSSSADDKLVVNSCQLDLNSSGVRVTDFKSKTVK